MKRPAGLAAVACALLAGIYLLYWNHVEFFGDDWILLPLYRQAAAEGPAGIAALLLRAARNLIYQVFRMQWISILYGFVVSWLGDFAVKFHFAALLALHAANAWLLALALLRFGVERGVALLAGALFVVLPTTRFVLFTYFTIPFFVFATFWVLLMLSWPAGRRRWLPALAVLGMFAGEQVLFLLAAVVPLAALCSGGRPWRAMLAVWGAMAAAAAAYLAFVNRRPFERSGRWDWRPSVLQGNVELIGEEWWKLTGLPADAPFHLAPVATDWLLAAGAAAVVAVALAQVRHGDRAATAPSGRGSVTAFVSTSARNRAATGGSGCAPGDELGLASILFT